MIGYLEGKLLKKEEDRILVLAGQVGYEVLLPAVVMETFREKTIGDSVSLYISYQQSERQPRPVLIGFNLEVEKEFFQRFISVEDIGPMKAVRALDIPVREIAAAIESGEVERLRRLKGIGPRTAQKIVATLKGKVGKFALIRPEGEKAPPEPEDFSLQVMAVLVDQLGHSRVEARRMVTGALQRNPGINTAEELFDEVYRGEITHE